MEEAITATLAIQKAIASLRLEFSPALTLQNLYLTDHAEYYPSQSKFKPMTLRDRVVKEIEQIPDALLEEILILCLDGQDAMVA
jgi:hypothetical protein